MSLSTYLTSIRNLPLPTDEQFERFAVHVADAHSWYKHLSLFLGAEFIVFLDPQAGGDFDEDQERIHHTWQTSREYREKFGHLAYMWKRHNEPEFNTDYQRNARVSLTTMKFVDKRETPVLVLPPEIRKACGFLLYPFACDNGVLISRYEEIFPALEEGILEHPCRDLLVRFYQASREEDNAAQVLEAEWERGAASGTVRIARSSTSENAGETIQTSTGYWLDLWNLACEEDVNPEPPLTPPEHDFVTACREKENAWQALEGHEGAKIQKALENLKRIAMEAGLAPSEHGE